ncbi:hypothetical protein ACU5EH_21855 [Aliivibrio salmonicida]|uniref:hypothetical protein n=1 Tax=Aliivibrio salmonicida TaxID=40269 RepID=UPI00406C27F9
MEYKLNISKPIFIALALIALLVFTSYATKEWRSEITGKAMLAQAKNAKMVMIEEAKAEQESAKYKKEADIIRAQGIAEANTIINGSLTDKYIRWLFFENLKQTKNQVIYLPTESGLPVLESNRLN